jgi:hypothetical protein
LGTLGGYLWINSTVTSTYATEGRGGLDNGCQASNYSKFPSRCLGENMAVLMGDSLANSMFPGFARGFDELGLTLVYMGRGGCGPLLLTPTLRPKEKSPQWFTWIRPGGCPKLYPLFDQLLAHPAREISLVVTPRFSDPNTVALWTELISRFDPARTRVLLLGPMPTFETPAMDCVILSDRHGISRDRCGRPRSQVEDFSRSFGQVFAKIAATSPGNIRYIDPIDVFCDAQFCRPFIGDQLMYDDGAHLLTSGVDLVWKTFEKDFRWVAWKN